VAVPIAVLAAAIIAVLPALAVVAVIIATAAVALGQDDRLYQLLQDAQAGSWTAKLRSYVQLPMVLRGLIGSTEFLDAAGDEPVDQAAVGQVATIAIYDAKRALGPEPAEELDLPAAAAAPAVPGVSEPPQASGLGTAGGLAGIAGGLAGIGVLMKALTSAQTATANAVRTSHQSRQACVASTGRTILSALAGVAGVVGIPLVLLSSDRGRKIVDTVIGTAWDMILDPSIIPKPADPDRALETARTLFAEKAALGAAAHLLAVAAESSANIKHMGMGYLAAFLADLAGFNRIAAATMGEVEWAALQLPMRHRTQRDYRPQLPALAELTMAYAKKEIPPGPIPEGFPPRAGFSETDERAPAVNLHEALARYGLPDDWIRVYSHHLFMDPRLTELVRMGQYYNPEIDPRSAGATEFMKAWIDARPWLLEEIGIKREEWDASPWLYFKASVAGYEPSDVRVIVETILRAVVRRDQTLMLDAITRLYRDGFIGMDRVQQLVEEAWGTRPGPDGSDTFRGDPIAARVRSTQVRTEYELLADRAEVALRAMSRGLMSEAEVREELAALGMPEDRVEIAVLREKMGLVPRTRLSVAAYVEDVPAPIAEEEGDV